MKGFEEIHANSSPEEQLPVQPEGMPAPEASAKELAEYILTQLSIPYDPKEPGAPSFEEHDKNQRFFAELAKDILPKMEDVNNERIKAELRQAIEKLEGVH